MLSHWLSPSAIYQNDFKSPFFQKSHKDGKDFPNIEDSGLVLMGIQDKFADEVRNQLHKLNNHFSNLESADIGNFNSCKETNLLMAAASLLENNNIPIFLGTDCNFIKQLQNEFDFKFTCISNNVPYAQFNDLNLNILAYQRHLCDYKTLKHIEDFSLDSLSLGKLRSNLHMLEPILRDTEALYLNINAVRCSDAPNSNSSLPFGLNAEEVCQMMRYAGSSNKLKAVIIDISGLDLNNFLVEAKLIAACLWYLMEGKNLSNIEHPSNNTDYSQYIVNLAEYDTDLIFVKSNFSNKWWLKTIDESQNETYISCAHEEYQLTINSEIPERILRYVLI